MPLQQSGSIYSEYGHVRLRYNELEFVGAAVKCRDSERGDWSSSMALELEMSSRSQQLQ